MGVAVIEHDAATVGWQTNQHSRFEVAAPRHFLLPAILLLLAEEPRHGYGLAKGVHALQVGRVDRPSVYRALAQLEADRLICSSPETSLAGQGRRVYSLTEHGEQALRGWMGVIKQERDGLDRVLRRYVATGTVDAVLAEVEGGWHAVTATPWSAVSSTSRIEHGRGSMMSAVPRHDSSDNAADDVDDEVTTSRFRVVPDRSAVMINARSSVGPITFGAIGVRGFIEVSVAGRRVCPVPYPTAHLEIDVDQLRSGNSLYDAELLRRIDARRHPTVVLDLRACTALGSTGRYQLQGEVTFHGVSKPLDGTVSVAMPGEGTLVIRGEQVVDIRDFGVVSPTVLMLRIYPDVVVGLQIEAELDQHDQPTPE
ncbi:MAG: PadR family transcriptional regulator, regulatory protein PadR [Ilumatobacteraceae bacterium]